MNTLNEKGGKSNRVEPIKYCKEGRIRGKEVGQRGIEQENKEGRCQGQRRETSINQLRQGMGEVNIRQQGQEDQYTSTSTQVGTRIRGNREVQTFSGRKEEERTGTEKPNAEIPDENRTDRTMQDRMQCFTQWEGRKEKGDACHKIQ